MSAPEDKNELEIIESESQDESSDEFKQRMDIVNMLRFVNCSGSKLEQSIRNRNA
ncbi:hypothetical protein SMD22_01485 (plasmid) [Brevibacillus halotolerans]|nr:hypothetical protein SMD22_01485 [Brevibacillus halotolerans]